jgi:hypothetical protein
MKNCLQVIETCGSRSMKFNVVARFREFEYSVRHFRSSRGALNYRNFIGKMGIFIGRKFWKS